MQTKTAHHAAYLMIMILWYSSSWCGHRGVCLFLDQEDLCLKESGADFEAQQIAPCACKSLCDGLFGLLCIKGRLRGQEQISLKPAFVVKFQRRSRRETLCACLNLSALGACVGDHHVGLALCVDGQDHRVQIVRCIRCKLDQVPCKKNLPVAGVLAVLTAFGKVQYAKCRGFSFGCSWVSLGRL